MNKLFSTELNSKTLALYAILILLGGFLGAISRHTFAFLLPSLQATIVVNTVGSFLIGVVLYRGSTHAKSHPFRYFFLVIGFIASFTTYSTFALITFMSPKFAIFNIIVTYSLGFFGVISGKFLATNFNRGRS
jgi:CrcB protein